ncbi:RNA pseudouridylate synthase [Phytophthora palmivora]|uniref:RNA pseudouridylate synthase n=1 Tax=Phytophthora palmivora TaxID=4796 RepID=A0A2P4Y8U2_9STRA|nr:RNA pseudouridylate synthase [Phytophthora palmivora]
MLNPIENEYPTFKTAVKSFMTESRMEILSLPVGVTMKDHRQFFLQTATSRFLPEVTTAERCHAYYRHTLHFHTLVTDFQDMPVGT